MLSFVNPNENKTIKVKEERKSTSSIDEIQDMPNKKNKSIHFTFPNNPSSSSLPRVAMNRVNDRRPDESSDLDDLQE